MYAVSYTHLDVYKRQVWNDVKSMRWCYDERDLDRELCVEREIELYELKRDYDELKEMVLRVIVTTRKKSKTNYK